MPQIEDTMPQVKSAKEKAILHYIHEVKGSITVCESQIEQDEKEIERLNRRIANQKGEIEIHQKVLNYLREQDRKILEERK